MVLFCSRVSVSVRFVAAIAALVVVRAANAQTGLIWATDANVGFSRGGGGEFVYRSQPVAEIGVSVRKPLRHSIGLDAEVDYDWSGNFNGQDLLCRLDSRGNCTPTFPEISGSIGLVGVTLGAADVVQLRVKRRSGRLQRRRHASRSAGGGNRCCAGSDLVARRGRRWACVRLAQLSRRSPDCDGVAPRPAPSGPAIALPSLTEQTARELLQVAALN